MGFISREPMTKPPPWTSTADAPVLALGENAVEVYGLDLKVGIYKKRRVEVSGEVRGLFELGPNFLQQPGALGAQFRLQALDELFRFFRRRVLRPGRPAVRRVGRWGDSIWTACAPLPFSASGPGRRLHGGGRVCGGFRQCRRWWR